MLGRLSVSLFVLATATAAVAQPKAPEGYVFKPAAACAEDAERAVRPQRPSDAAYQVCADQMALYLKGLADASAAGKLLLVTFGATWCPWCATLQKAMHGPELLGHTRDGLALGTSFHHIEIGLSMLHKGKKAEIPSGEAVLAHVLKSAPDVKIRAIPFVAVIDPQDTRKVYARNIDDAGRKDGTHDLVRVRDVLAEAKAVTAGKAAQPSEPGWLKRKWLRWWYG